MPDAELKPQRYRDARPQELFDHFHRHAREHRPDAMYELIRVLVTLWGLIAFRARAIGVDNVPFTGPVVLAPNHFSFMDHFLVGMFFRRHMRIMAKSQLFTRGTIPIFTHGGCFPVRRGYHDEQAFATAHELLRQGELLVMYCEGGRSRTGRPGEEARPGIGRIALESGAPIVPVAIHGSQRIRNWRRGQLPQVHVRYGAPLRFQRVADPDRDQQLAAANHIFGEVKAMWEELDRRGPRRVARRVEAQRRLSGMS